MLTTEQLYVISPEFSIHYSMFRPSWPSSGNTQNRNSFVLHQDGQAGRNML